MDSQGRDGAPGLPDVLQAPELVLALGLAAGVRASCGLSESCGALRSSFRELLPTLAQRLPPRLYVVGGRSGRSSHDSQTLAEARALCPEAARWEVLPEMPSARQDCSVVGLRGMLYVLGGTEEVHGLLEPLACVERFCVATGFWVSLAPMSAARYACAAAAVAGRVCVAGGWNGGEWEPGGGQVVAAEALDPELGAWAPLPELPAPRGRCSSCALRGALYVVGGLDGRERCTGAVERLRAGEGEAGTWEGLPPLPTPRAACAAAAAGDAIYVLGGIGDGVGAAPLDVVERLDLLSGTWAAVQPMDTPRRCFAAASCAGAVYVVGGLAWAARATATVERLGPDGVWRSGSKLPVAVSGCGAATLWP